jgi:hypothetical protein
MNSKVELEADVVAALERGRKVDAIKKLREIRGIGLKESKELVDLYASQNPLVGASSGGESPGANAAIGVLIVCGVIGYFVYQFVIL